MMISTSLWTDQPDVAETVIADLDQEDFDLDTPPGTDGDMEGSATVIASLDEDMLWMTIFPSTPRHRSNHRPLRMTCRSKR
jgi:hypothetical protein